MHGPRATAFPIEATLDVEGTPQSGTGQAALLTGVSAAERFGRHFGPWVPVALRPIVEQESLLAHAVAKGLDVAFANAYPRGWPGARGERRLAGPPLAARGASLLTRHEESLGTGEAVSSEIVNDGWRSRLGFDWLPVITPGQAGENLARIASAHHLTLYAHYTTDTAGHRKAMEPAVAALERVDSFLGGVMSGVGDDVTILVVSDHGNIEDVSKGHTRNPVLGLAAGAERERVASIGDLRDVFSAVDDLTGAANAS